jgi:uncharacterized protein YkwD
MIVILFFSFVAQADAKPIVRAASQVDLNQSLFLPFITTSPSTGPVWLSYINRMRSLGSIAPVTENPDWSDGDWKHARYMVKNDLIGHDEDTSMPYYSPEGAQAAANGNVMVHSDINAADEYAINLWLSGPFHALGILDPRLEQTGFSSYREYDGGWQMGAVLDVIRGRTGSLPPEAYPVMWPGSHATATLTTYGGNESPDPLTSCPGYSAPTGQPVYLILGSGEVTPSVTSHSFLKGGAPVDHCIFDQTNYSNPYPSLQSMARSILNSRDAVVLIPRAPLVPGETYNVSITVNNQTFAWEFSVAAVP